MGFPGSFSRISVVTLGLAGGVATVAAATLMAPTSCIDGTTPNCADAACSIAFDGGPDASDAQIEGSSDAKGLPDVGTDSGVPPADSGSGSPDAGSPPDSGQPSDGSTDAVRG